MATLSNQGIPAGGNGILHPKLKNKWQITFIGIAALVAGVDGRNLTRQAVDVTRPQVEFEEITLYRYNSRAYIPGAHTFSAMSLTVEDDITGLASKVIVGQLETQQRLVGVDLDGRWLNTAATGSDLKFAMKLEMLDGDEGVVSTWVYEGCWLQSVDFNDLSYSASEAAQIQMSIRYDHVRTISTGDGYGTALGGFIQ